MAPGPLRIHYSLHGFRPATRFALRIVLGDKPKWHLLSSKHLGVMPVRFCAIDVFVNQQSPENMTGVS